ncbi:hypothetical protein C0995_003658 [Termitomyces sp. Mi166|nr:hypothetical protein C0995_003658 [Termitomyces sp. Mi166\
MRKALIANKEVQTSIVNFRKDGSAFINLVSVIPILGGETGTKHELNDVVYHVGFQVDLTEQPNAILEKLRDGSYTQNTLPLGPAVPYADLLSPPSHHTQHELLPPPPQRKQQLPAILMASSLAQALTNPALHRDLPVATSTTAPSPLLPASTTSTSSAVSSSTMNNPLSLILLEYAPDFILVVSLKGAFLYVAPAVSRVLGHSPSALVGRSISDLAHPEDVVPLERQLKESSTLVNVIVPSSNDNASEYHQQHAKLIDVLFRARTKHGSYVWVEARGRLHVEPGKGRKAIVLSARARRMPRVRWGDLLPPLPVSVSLSTDESGRAKTHEFWAQLSGLGKAAGAFVSVGNGAEGVFGWKRADVLGRRISALVVEEDRERVEGVLRAIEGREGEGRIVVFVRVRMEGEEGEVVRVRLAFYPTRSDEGEADDGGEMASLGIAPPIVLLHVARGEGIDNLSSGDPEQRLHDPDENVFAELEVRRGSSWQYELQQLRFRNMRLREEVKALEREVRTFEGREAEEGDQAREVTVESTTARTTTGNPYPSPHYSPDVSSVSSVNVERLEGNAFGYEVQSQPQTPEEQGQGQTHANYTAALEQYPDGSGGSTYEGLEMALGVGMGVGMGMGNTMNMGTSRMDMAPASSASSSSYELQTQVDHLTHNQHHQRQHQDVRQFSTTQSPMYAPQPVHSHSHSSSGLLHALGSSSSSYQSHQYQQQQHPIQRPRPPMVRAYDPRSQQPRVNVNGDLGRRRAESQSQWAGSVMHPGVKRSFGGR